jgi:hypothetical protein
MSFNTVGILYTTDEARLQQEGNRFVWLIKSHWLKSERKQYIIKNLEQRLVAFFTLAYDLLGRRSGGDNWLVNITTEGET